MPSPQTLQELDSAGLRACEGGADETNHICVTHEVTRRHCDDVQATNGADAGSVMSVQHKQRNLLWYPQQKPHFSQQSTSSVECRETAAKCEG